MSENYKWDALIDQRIHWDRFLARLTISSRSHMQIRKSGIGRGFLSQTL